MVGVDAGMSRPALGDELAVPFHRVLVLEAGAAHLGAPGVDHQPVVEGDGPDVAGVDLGGRSLDAGVPQSLVAAGEPPEVLDACGLEPDEVGGVVGDALRVGLGEAHGDLELEGVAVDGETLGRERSTACRALPQEGPAVVLTGAGISTESGIPDFRSPTGIWAQYDPAEYATIEAFRADPVKVWSFYSLRLRVLVEAEPNDGHRALARLERAGHVSAVVTQNIDGLHQRAGSRDVTEVHGSIRSSTCLQCGASYSLAELLELLEAQRLRPVRNAARS